MLYSACPFRESILSFDENDAPQEKRLRPAVLDAQHISRLFRDALAEGKWGAFAEWLREELIYSSATQFRTLQGKVEFVRYMTERVMMWHQDPDYNRKDFSVACGTVMEQGVRRPCTALYYRGIPSALTVFDDYQGMVGRMRNMAWDSHCTYVQESEPIPMLAREGDKPVVEPYLQLPPHAAIADCKDPEAPDSPLTIAMVRVMQHLRRCGSVPVAYDTAAEACPHIWFRDATGRLSWLVIYSADWRETEFDGKLSLRDAYLIKKLRHYPGYMAAAVVHDAGAMAEVSLEPVDWSDWVNL